MKTDVAPPGLELYFYISKFSNKNKTHFKLANVIFPEKS